MDSHKVPTWTDPELDFWGDLYIFLLTLFISCYGIRTHSLMYINVLVKKRFNLLSESVRQFEVVEPSVFYFSVLKIINLIILKLEIRQVVLLSTNSTL